MSGVRISAKQDIQLRQTIYTVEVTERFQIEKRLPIHAEFNPIGGISLDYDGAWKDGDTVNLHPESIAAQLMRLAFIAAHGVQFRPS